jgi:Ca2+-binding RTX toxin-like protein
MAVMISVVAAVAYAAEVRCPSRGDCFGTSKADDIFGTTGADDIFARGGGDLVKAKAGDDDVFGQGGEDTLFAQAGNDDVSGGGSEDLIKGAAGNDSLSGFDGPDTIIAGTGADNAFGNEGNDNINVVDGVATFNPLGNDTANGGSETDICRGDWTDTNQSGVVATTEPRDRLDSATCETRVYVDTVDGSVTTRTTGQSPLD